MKREQTKGKTKKVTDEIIDKLLLFLPVGEDNGIHANELFEQLQLEDKRQLRKLIEYARNKGTVIATGDKGYYLPATATEAQVSYNRLAGQGASMIKAAQPLRVWASRVRDGKKPEYFINDIGGIM